LIVTVNFRTSRIPSQHIYAHNIRHHLFQAKITPHDVYK